MVHFKLIDIVKQHMSEIGLESDHGIERFLQFGINAVRELHMDFTGAPTWKTIEVNQNSMTAPIPDDCIRILRIGALTERNNLVKLILDNNMVLNASPSEPFGNRAFSTSQDADYGSNAIHGSSYRENILSGNFKISSDLNAKCIYVEYLADINRINGQIMVHPYNIEAIKAYIRWVSIRGMDESQLGRIQLAKRDWVNEREHAKNRTLSFTVDEIIENHLKELTGTLRM